MSLTEIIDYLKANAAEREIELRPGVDEDLIRAVEETYNLTLPYLMMLNSFAGSAMGLILMTGCSI